MKCTTVLHGGVRHRTSTPDKSGNKRRKKKKKWYVIMYVTNLEDLINIAAVAIMTVS